MRARGMLGAARGGAADAGGAPAGAAQLRTCVRVEAGRPTRRRSTRLVKAEIDRHPTHRAADHDCQGYLTVELIDLGAQNEKWVTGRHQHAGPAPREGRRRRDRPAPCERLLTVVLNNDPLILHGPESNTWLAAPGPRARAAERHALRRRGLRAGRAARLDRSTRCPGVAFTVRREVSALHVGARLGGAFNPGSAARSAAPARAVRRPDRGALYASPAENTSLFASALRGPGLPAASTDRRPLDGPGATGTATSTGLSLGAARRRRDAAHRRRAPPGVPAG